MNKLTLWQRLSGDTPAFFKRMQVLGGSLMVLAGALAAVPGVSSGITGPLLTAGGVIVAVSQFAVTNTSPQNNQPKA